MSAIGHTSSSLGLGARDSAAGPAALQVVTNNEQVDFAGGQGKKRTAPISLLISPNLDALLEHEERTRGQNTPARSDAEPGTPETSRQSLTPIAEIPIGLPPPPRYSRGPKSPRTPLVGNMRAEPLFSEVKLMQPVSQESEEVESVSPLLPVSSSTSNPYINPAPTLDDVLGDGISRKEDGVSGGTGTTDVIESPGELAAVGSSENGGSRRASRDGSAPLPWSPTWKQQSQSKYVSLPHVDSACTTNRNEFGKPPDADTQNTQVFQEAAASPSTSSVLGRPASFVAAQIRGRLVKKRSVKASDMRQTPINVVEGVGSGREAGSNNLPWRRRPLISHGPKSSVSSSDSMSSFSTNGPPSTAEHEPRISISSTIYSASSMHSHSQSLYNPPMSYRNSFMEIYSPTNPDFGLDHDSTAHDPVSPIYFSESSPISSLTPPLDSHSPKPPIPTAPKPVFNRLVLRTGQPSPMPTAIPLPIPSDKQHSPLPPTTNFLDIDERAELIRKSRKLARVFGQTPGADAMAQQDSNRSASNSSLKAKARSQATLSLTNDPRPRSAWRATAETLHLATPRRHSMPLSPDDISFLSIASPTFENHQPPQTSSAKDQKNRKDGSSNDLSLNRATTPQLRSDSPASFIDLSDDEGARATAKKATTSRPHSPTHSIISTMTVEEDQADEERRRKRERLAKLHRFLGSQVPANLVLGIDDLETSLPPPLPAAASSKGTISTESDDSPRKTWLKRRRSSSAAMLPSFRPDDQLERVKDELDDKEKAINVRRAHKMEQVFGVAPPQTLFHTRQTATPVFPAAKPIVLQPTPVVAPPAEIVSAPIQRNNNRSAYNKTPKPKKNRPGTAESSKQLLPKEFGGFGPDAMLAGGAVARHSFIYNHYQHSLNSLNDILDRDDRESLAELHEYLNNTDLPTPTATPKADEEFTNQQYDRRLSIASSIKSERRRSLPARTSMISLAPTEYSISTPLADVTPFQLRRRRAAKLTQFFGVNYRELINDVLESIENGVEHEQLRGTLAADEVEDLLTKLRTLKIKRSGLL